MPKATFYNLPEEKRLIIEQIAADEFADRGFEAASISQMVSRAGIAKGSFYQYFEDKSDLFQHLVNRVAEEKKIRLKENHPPDPTMDFFATLRWMFKTGFEYNANQSRINQAVSRVLFGEGLFLGPMFQEARESSARMWTAMIQQAAERGELSRDVSPEVAAFVVETLINSLGMFILNQQSINRDDLIHGNIDWLNSDQSAQIVESLLRILENGLRNRGSE